jgi:hypothetical protein
MSNSVSAWRQKTLDEVQDLVYRVSEARNALELAKRDMQDETSTCGYQWLKLEQCENSIKGLKKTQEYLQKYLEMVKYA